MSKLRIAVITSIFGDYDPPKLVPTEFDDAVFVTDSDVDADGWEVYSGRSPTTRYEASLATKLPKTTPQLFTECEASLWIDGSMELLPGAYEFCQHLLSQGDLWQFKHPWRRCAYDEAPHAEYRASQAGLGDQPFDQQMEAYRNRGFPREFGLWATGVILRRHTPAINAWGHRWYQHIKMWTTRDQLSHPFVCWETNIEPMSLPGDLYDENRLIKIHKHNWEN